MYRHLESPDTPANLWTQFRDVIPNLLRASSGIPTEIKDIPSWALNVAAPLILSTPILGEYRTLPALEMLAAVFIVASTARYLEKKTQNSMLHTSKQEQSISNTSHNQKKRLAKKVHKKM